MFGRKPSVREGTHVFAPHPASDETYQKFIFGVITGVEGNKIGVNGFIVDPVGLKNKVDTGKAGPRSVDVLEHPTSENCIFALIYRIEYDNFTEVLDITDDHVQMIPPKVYSNLDRWVSEGLPELVNNVLSLPPGDERDQAKRKLRQKMDSLLDKNLKKNLYSVCRSLKILN
jgi:hypothetical protein